jgi:hypothetical protein
MHLPRRSCNAATQQFDLWRFNLVTQIGRLRRPWAADVVEAHTWLRIASTVLGWHAALQCNKRIAAEVDTAH